MRPLRKGLAIGTSDGRLSYVVSKDHAFLSRLLEFLTLKINTWNEGLTASFDITNNVFNTNRVFVTRVFANGVPRNYGRQAGREFILSMDIER